MRLRRRLVFQLTPLLDLMLIIVFLQFLEVREHEATTVDAAREAVTERDQAAAKLAQLEDEYRQALAARTQADANEARLTSQNQELQDRVQRLQADVERSTAQQRLLGELAKQLFQVPDEVVAQALTPAGAATPAASEEQRQLLQSRFHELAEQSPGRMIRHILSYEEMRKRCDLWELHIDDNGWFTLKAGKEVREFRAASPVEFSDRFYAIYKSLPEPKSLVVILLSYGDARADVREAALQGLPQVTDRMWRHAGGAIRFEYAVLGFQPQPD